MYGYSVYTKTNPNDQNYKFKTNLSLKKKALPKKLLFLVKVFAIKVFVKQKSLFWYLDLGF